MLVYGQQLFRFVDTCVGMFLAGLFCWTILQITVLTTRYIYNSIAGLRAPEGDSFDEDNPQRIRQGGRTYQLSPNDWKRLQRR